MLTNMFIYVAREGHRKNLQSSFELQRKTTGFKLGHKMGTVPIIIMSDGIIRFLVK